MASSCFVLLGLAILYTYLSYHCIFNQQNGLVSVPLVRVYITSIENDTRAALSLVDYITPANQSAEHRLVSFSFLLVPLLTLNVQLGLSIVESKVFHFDIFNLCFTSLD